MGTVSIEALAALLNHCEHFAKRMLTEAGEFHPFAAFVNQDGGLEALGAYADQRRLSGKDSYRLLEETLGLMARDGKVLASAIAANVDIRSLQLPPLRDGIRVHIEAAGYSRLVYTPYRLLSFRAVRKFFVVLPTVQYAEPITVDVPGVLFAAAKI